MTASQGSDGSLRFVAHRGYVARYPENTLEGLQAAVDAGARYIEFDVQLTRDAVPVLLHDESFQRTAGVERSVFDLDAAELAGIEVNETERLDGRYSGVTVPTLQDTCAALAGWNGVTAFVELKRHSIAHFGVAKVAEVVLDLLRPVLDRCVVISFNHDVLQACRKRADLPVGWVLRKWDAATRATAEASQPDYLLVNEKRLPPDGPVWPGPWTWICYDITDYQRALDLHARGIGMISSFDIAHLLAAVRDAGTKS